MPVQRDTSQKWQADAQSWVTHIQQLEDRCHKLTEEIWEFKKKQVKQVMMKMRWGDSALRQSCFTSWKEGIQKVKADRIIEDEARNRHRYETEISMLKYRVEELERNNSRMQNEKQEQEERLMREGALRRKLEKKAEV